MSNSKYITSFNEKKPQIADGVFVDISARLIGAVTLEEKSSVWPGTVLRADEDKIVVGRGSAILDLCLIESPQNKPVIIEPQSLVSHKACLHGATVKRGALVGVGAIVLDRAVIGEGALVGAGAVVPPGMEVPPGMLMLGQPARPIRELKPEERENIRAQVVELQEKAAVYLSMKL